MLVALEKETIPLKTDRDDVIRVADTRVTLDMVVQSFHEGATPEEIVQQFPSLDLGDVYAVIGYYLRHRSDLDDYLRTREDEAGRLRRENEARFDPMGIRERLLARRTS